MINNEKLDHPTNPESFGCYSMSSSCKVIGFHKWSLKFSQNVYRKDISNLFQYNLVSIHDNFYFMSQNYKQNK